MSQSRITPLSLGRLAAMLTIASLCGRARANEDERAACATTAEQAQEMRAAHKLIEARNKLIDCARTSCPNVVSQDCTQWLSEMTAVTPSVVISATDAAGHSVTGVRVLLDGVKVLDGLNGEALPVDPGAHQLRFEADGMRPVEQQLSLEEGETNRSIAVRLVALQPPAPFTNPAPPSQGSRFKATLPYALAGVGAVALGSFAYFGIKGKSEANDLADTCGATKTCSESQVAPVRHHLLMADVSLGISLVTLGVATWMFISQHSAKTKDTTVVQVGAAPGAGVVRLNLAF
jgi:hypothetical protein